MIDFILTLFLKGFKNSKANLTSTILVTSTLLLTPTVSYDYIQEINFHFRFIKGELDTGMKTIELFNKSL